jgi:hypothetical protein
LNTRSTTRFNARITPIRANIVGPQLSATQEQCFHRGLPFRHIVFGLRQLRYVFCRVP